jgi:hypothetical protein
MEKGRNHMITGGHGKIAMPEISRRNSRDSCLAIRRYFGSHHRGKTAFLVIRFPFLGAGIFAARTLLFNGQLTTASRGKTIQL